MKKYVVFAITLILLIIFVHSNAQDLSDKNEVVLPKFRPEDVSSVLMADNATLVNHYLLSNIVCPELAAECGKEGTEIVRFTVTKTGDVKDFKVINSVCSELDNEVIRVLKTTNGKWKPGLEHKEPVETTKEVAFMFGDHNSSTIAEYFVKIATGYYNKGCKSRW